MKGAELVVSALKQQGIETVFGYPGGAIMPIYDALYDGGVEHILCRHEQGAAMAAIGMARATQDVAVCMATSGPGATNLVTGLADAFMDSIPLVAITGQVASSHIGTDAFQEMDVIGMSLSCTKHSYLVTDTNAPIRGDINKIMPQLELSQDISSWVHHSEGLRSSFKWRYDHPGDLIFAPLLLKQLSDMMPASSMVSTDVGQHQMWAAQHIQPRDPQNFITSAGLGTMGFGLPAAMGASVGRPDDQSILISGDGSFMMNVQELGTLKRRQIPVKMVLLNNSRLGMVRQWQSLFFDGRHSETILDDNPDFVMLAKAFDIPGKTITRKEEVEPALKEMLESKTAYLLHVLIDEEENVWPLVPPGASNSEMLENT
ncbi:UNVERIFIED_CONTAM: hypothetical protein GTU68_027438 [Idotea baltica]|nr:hypothetical protein [Idotea baltica]